MQERWTQLGQALTMLRVQLGLAQVEVAQRAGIRPNQISRYETGQVLPQLDQLTRILDALEVDVLEFFLFHEQVREIDAGRRAAAQAPPAAKRFFHELRVKHLAHGRELRRLVERLTKEESAGAAREDGGLEGGGGRGGAGPAGRAR